METLNITLRRSDNNKSYKITIDEPNLDKLDRAIIGIITKSYIYTHVRSIHLRDVKLTEDSIHKLKSGATYTLYLSQVSKSCLKLCDVYLFEDI